MAADGPREAIAKLLRQTGEQPDDEIDLARTALLLAALERPHEPLARYRHHLSLLERDAADLAAAPGGVDSLERRIEIINRLLFERYGYAGDHDTYDDLQNSDMMRVIDRRRGLPVALGILYLQVAHSQSWSAEGLAFPGHFLVRLDYGSERAIIDPFNGGQLRHPSELRELLKVLAGVDAELEPGHYAAVANRDVLLRLQNNRKLRLLREQDTEAAAKVVEGMLLIAPHTRELWREAGLLQLHLENLRAASHALEQFLKLAQDDPRRAEVQDLLRRLRHRIN
ncbi:MAG TPA: transglutaminase-like domain-containing protein [Kiloniellales bacterium]|nr:transglutaminase-like domain-containing protein [Kiloniellales bacterium]